MLYHFAITPEVFKPRAINDMKPAGVVLVALLRGMCENGMLANLHAGEWLTHVRLSQMQDGIPTSVRDHIESCLTILYDRNRLVRHPAGSSDFDDDDCRWVHWSLERHQNDPHNPLSGVFSSDELAESSKVADDVLVRLSTALDADCWTGRTRTVLFTKTESNLREHLTPIVRYAQKVNLIDPYMTCRVDRFFNTVQHCADLLGRRDGKQHPGVIHIHAGDPVNDGPNKYHESTDDRLRRWKEALGPLARQHGHSFGVLLWKRKPRGQRFHDRYIITDQCGVVSPGGLDFLPDEQEQQANNSTWTLLDAVNARLVLSDEFHQSKSPYQFLGSIKVKP